MEALYHRAPRAASDFAAINLADGRKARKGTGGEGLVCAIAFGEREITFKDGDVVSFAQVNNLAARNPAETIIPGRGPNLAFADDKEMRRITGRNKALRIEHQAFIYAGFDGLDTGGHAVDFGMGVQPRVLHIRPPAPNRDRIKAQRPSSSGGVCGFKFRRDNNGGFGNHNTRILIWRGAKPPRDHEANMHTFRHLIGFKCFVKARRQFGLGETYIQI